MKTITKGTPYHQKATVNSKRLLRTVKKFYIVDKMNENLAKYFCDKMGAIYKTRKRKQRSYLSY